MAKIFPATATVSIVLKYSMSLSRSGLKPKKYCDGLKLEKNDKGKVQKKLLTPSSLWLNPPPPP